MIRFIRIGLSVIQDENSITAVAENRKPPGKIHSFVTNQGIVASFVYCLVSCAKNLKNFLISLSKFRVLQRYKE